MMNFELPQDRLAGLKQNWKTDLTSGFIVFLIALPLCLGIALASGVPPMAGLIAAIVGGVIVSQLSGSYVTINGPAAGLIVVILGAVESLGQGDPIVGYKATLAAIVVSGVLLAILGLLRAGKLGAFFPSSAVHGMLAAIGVIIISKQVHVAMGVKPLGKEPLELIAEIPHSLSVLNPEIAFIGVISLAILIGLSFAKNKWVKMVPAPMVVVLVGIALGHYFDLDHSHQYLFTEKTFDIGPRFLVTLPANALDGIVFPDWTHLGTGAFWVAVISITLVQGIETLLSATAVDKLDPWQRKSNLNRDVTAMGVGSAVSGMLGGLPMIAEIVRSSANVANGARTRWSNFFHGVLLLVFVVFFPQLIHQIPLAALAAILAFTGYRLASPKEFRSTFKIGSEQLAIFCTTLLVTLATDLIIGVASGILLKFVMHIARGARLKSLFKTEVEVVALEDEAYEVTVKDAAIFSNYLSIKAVLDKLPQKKQLVLNLAEVDIIDHTVMEHLHQYAHEYERSGGHLTMVGIDQLIPVSDHPMATRIVARKAAAV
jgi:MFS superfamily sulfate permease-like transporter